MRIENKYKVNELTYEASAFVYCPMGNDWGHIDIFAKIKPNKYLPDYCDIDNFIEKNIEGKTLITEAVGFEVYNFIKNEIEPERLSVKVHSNNTSMHSCHTTIGDEL